jgi:hypothetical protein
VGQNSLSGDGTHEQAFDVNVDCNDRVLHTAEAPPAADSAALSSADENVGVCAESANRAVTVLEWRTTKNNDAKHTKNFMETTVEQDHFSTEKPFCFCDFESRAEQVRWPK